MSSAWYATRSALELKRCLPSEEYDRCRLGRDSASSDPENFERLIVSRRCVTSNQMLAMLTLRTWSSDRVWVTRCEYHAVSSAWYATGSPFELRRWFPSAEFDPCCPGRDSASSDPENLERWTDSRRFVTLNQMVAMLTMGTWLSSDRVW